MYVRFPMPILVLYGVLNIYRFLEVFSLKLTILYSLYAVPMLLLCKFLQLCFANTHKDLSMILCDNLEVTIY